MELSDVYSERIIEIAANLPVTTPLVAPDATARKTSRICGSRIEVSLNVKDGIVRDYAHEVSACALGQTSASIVAQNIVGASVDELYALRDTMVAMLKKNGPPPTERWDDMKYLEAVRDYPARHTSTLLVLEAVVDCLDQIATKAHA